MQKIKLFSSVKVRVLFFMFGLLGCGLIFYMSAEPAVVSTERSSSLSYTLLKLVMPDFETLGEARQTELAKTTEHVLRKGAHFCIYMALGIFACLFSMCFASSGQTHFFRSFAFCFLFAVGDEWHQWFVPGRAARGSDILLDSAGALCGILLILYATKVWLRRKNAFHQNR